MTELGRRERKKAATRQALADAAITLFLERGYDAVGVREIADAADVSVTTLFKHFPDGKEALVFDEEEDREAALIAAVRDRAPGTSIPQALRNLLRDRRARRVHEDPRFPDFLRLVDETPVLREHARRMWVRHEKALAAAIAAESEFPESDPAARALAHFALEAVTLAQGEADSDAALDRIFDLLEHGWSTVRA